MSSFKIVIIEDEKAHFSLMERAIIDQIPDALVYDFQEAGACLKGLDEINPDIIITDYLMPGMNGIEFLESLKRDKRDIPVIMITGQGDEKIAVQAMKLGAWDYIVKSPGFFSLLPSVIEKVTRERRLEESLRESEKRFHDLAEITSDWIWEIDPIGRVIYTNSMVRKILGYTPEEMMGRYFYDFFPSEGQEDLKKFVFDIIEHKRIISNFEHTIVHKDGYDVIVASNAFPVFSKDGELICHRGVHRNITARKLAEKALRASEEKFRRIFEESPIGIELYDSGGRMIDANRSCLDIFGIDRVSDLQGFKLSENPNVPENAKARLLKGETVRYETTYDFELVRKHKLYKTIKSDPIHLDVLITQLGRRGKDSFAGYLVQIQDNTIGKQAQESVSWLSRQLMKAQEIERQKISRDLHDNLAQDLSTLKIRIDTVLDNRPEAPVSLQKRLAELSKIVQGTISYVRNLAHDLSPADLSQLGLVRTIRQHCEEFSERNGTRVDFFSAGMEGIRLDFDTEITLYRLTQEGMNNIFKHAEATHVTVRLVASFPKIILRIKDNGKGFILKERLKAAHTERHMGIRSMKERVALLNGNIRFESHPMQGTRILVEVPYKEQAIGKKEDSPHH
jgi:PAS domain S-box-containing protein